MLDTRTERVAIAARDSLVAAGLIEYSRGKKRSPNTYRLKYTHQKVSESGSVFDSESDSISSSVSVLKTVSHIKDKDVSFVPPSPERRDRNRFLSTTRFHIALRAGSRIRSKNACRTARRIQKRPCKAGRQTSKNVTGWTSTTGKASTKSCSFRSPIHSGRATSCREANLESNLRNSWRRWEAICNAGHLGS